MTKIIKTDKNIIESNYSEGEDKTTIKLVGNFTFAIVSEFRKAYESQPVASQYVLDLADVDAFDSAGLGCILVMFQYINEKNQQVKLIILNASKDIKKVLECAKITDIAEGIEFQQTIPHHA